MFFLDEEFRITHIAGSLAEWLGQRQATLVGEPIVTVVETADIGALEAALELVTESQTSQTIACHFVVDGEPRAVDIELSPVASESSLGAIVGRVDRETFSGGERTPQLVQLRNFIELLDDAAVIYELAETEPIVQAVNAAFEDTFGYGADRLVGESLTEHVVPAEGREEAARFDEQIDDGDVKTAIVQRQTASGIQTFSYRGLPIDRDSDRTYVLAIYDEMTDEQEARQHLRVLHRVLRHNVRNELTVILGMAEQIDAAATSDQVRDAAARITARAEDLASVSEKARMAESLLGESPSDTIVEVGTEATDVVAEARAAWPEVTFETDIESPVPVSTGLEIKDALENLVENAVVHNTGSPPVVRVTTRTETPIHATTRAAGTNVVITVADNGPGIPEHEQAVIFEGADMTQLRHGSGLGLWVVRWIVESADGTVSYAREDGWTTITLRLPVATDIGDVTDNGTVNQDQS